MKTFLDHPIRTPATGIGQGSASSQILVVDDDESVRRLEATILSAAGHRVTTAEGGEAAWRALLRSHFDLLVTDYLMPGVSGLALVRQLRVANLALPVVLVTATLATLDTTTLSRDPWYQIRTFVQKPFAVSELLAAVDGALALRSVDARSGHLAPA